MNPFNIHIDVLKGPTPPGPVVKSADFNLLQQAKILIEQAHKQAADLLQNADYQASEIRQKAAQLGELEKAQWMRQIREETYHTIVQEKLTWLVEQQAFEAAIVNSIDWRIREVMVSVLREWVDNQDQLAQLASRLAKLVCERAARSLCKLRLCPTECESVSAQLNQRLNFDSIEYIADPALNAGQAVIETEFLRIEFDLNRHWEAVFAALRRMEAEK